MLAQALYPKKLDSFELDEFLSKGWFRMNQSIFTTNFIQFNNQFYSTIWLRVNLIEYKQTSTHKKITKLNSSFTIKFSPATVDNEKEELYEKYKSGVSFEASESLMQLLNCNNSGNTIYNTQEVCVYDNKKLIAIGYFDIGYKTSAGIACIYNPDYKKYSLGKYLMYLKIAYSKSLNLTYFYPGYFVPGYKKFDYKLDLAKEQLEYFNIQKQDWIASTTYSDKDNHLYWMNYKLMMLKDALRCVGHEFTILQYKYFDACLLPNLNIPHLLDTPLFLFLYDVDENNMIPLIVFDLFSNKYQLIQCMSVWQANNYSENSEYYNSNLLQKIEVLFEDKSIHEVVQFLIESA